MTWWSRIISKCFLSYDFYRVRNIHHLSFYIAALEKAIGLAVADADVSTICGTIDSYIQEELLKVFSNKKSKKLERGIAFPTCLSINEIMGHFSPCPDDSQKLKNEDLVKIELGAHIDGFAAQAAHTVVVGGKSAGR